MSSPIDWNIYLGMVIDIDFGELSEEESVQGPLRLLRHYWDSAEYYQVLVTWG